MQVKVLSGKAKKKAAVIQIETLKVLPDGSVIFSGTCGKVVKSLELSSDLFNQLVRTRFVMDQLETAVQLPKAG